MRHLSLARKAEQNSTETEAVEQEDPLSLSLLSAIDLCLDALKEHGVPVEVVLAPSIESRIAEMKTLESLSENEAKYLRIGDCESDEFEKHILAIRRTQGTESVLTFFIVRRDSEAIKDFTVFQEVNGSKIDLKAQTSINYHPGQSNSVSTIRSVISPEGLVRKSTTNNDKDAVEAAMEISAKASAYPTRDIVKRAITGEMDKIKANLRGRSTPRAIGAAILHFPEFVRQQKAA